MSGTGPADARAKWVREGRMFFLFAIVGTIAFVIDAVVLKAGLMAGLERGVARILSLGVGMHFTFAVNRIWAFKGLRAQPLIQQWGGYILANSAGALINYAVFLALTGKDAPLDGAPILAVGAGSVAGMVVNFAGSRLLAFRR